MLNLIAKYKIIIIAIIAGALLIAGIVFWGNGKLKLAHKQAENYLNYQSDFSEFSKVRKSDKNDLYYYAANGKRLVFPTLEIYQTWFSNTLEEIPINSLDEFYKTSLAGNVTCRPGTLIQTQTISDVFIVVKNGQINPIATDIIAELYGPDWQSKVVAIPNYFFTDYVIGKPINSYEDFPALPAQITIDSDKGLK